MSQSELLKKVVAALEATGTPYIEHWTKVEPA